MWNFSFKDVYSRIIEHTKCSFKIEDTNTVFHAQKPGLFWTSFTQILTSSRKNKTSTSHKGSFINDVTQVGGRGYGKLISLSMYYDILIHTCMKQDQSYFRQVFYLREDNFGLNYKKNIAFKISHKIVASFTENYPS